jgi:hypothetical protein
MIIKSFVCLISTFEYGKEMLTTTQMILQDGALLLTETVTKSNHRG